MQPALLLIMLLMVSFAESIGYWYALIGWIQDIHTGVYKCNHIEAIWETTALGGYTYLAFRFLRSKLMH